MGRPALDPVPGETLAETEQTRVDLLVDSTHLAAADNVVTAGGVTPPPHLHRGHVECFVVLDGAMTVSSDEISSKVEAGALALVPRSVGHAFTVAEEARFVDLHAPAMGFGSFLRALHEAHDEHALAAARRAWDQEPVERASAGQPIVVRLEQGEVITDRPNRRVSLLVDTTDLAASFSRYAPGEHGPAPHVHHLHTDSFLVLEGTLSFTIGELPLHAPAGTLVAVPPEIVHSFRNDGDVDARFLNLHAPSCGFGEYLRGRNPGFDQHDPPANVETDHARIAVRTLRSL